MTDPSRLVDGEGDLEKSVLRSWSDRQPSEGARLKTLAALGVGGVAVAAGGGVGVAGGAGASIAPKAIVASSVLLKWAAVAGGVAATAGVAGYVVHDARDARRTSAAASASPAAVAPANAASPRTAPSEVALVAPPAPPELASPPATRVVSAPRSGAPVASLPPASPPAGSPPAPAASLDDEVAAIGEARRTLASGDAAAALVLVDAYDARYPSGALAQESTELRIEALYRADRRAQADRLAARFLAAHPQSPYARVIRGLQAGGAAPAP